MIAVPPGELQVESDLQLEVAGVPAELLADGRRLTLSTQHAGRFVAHARDALPAASGSWRAALREVAGALDLAGLTAVLADDRGTVAELGRGCDSVLGRLVLRSEHARLGPVSVLVGASLVRVEVGRRRLAVAAGGGALAGLVLIAGLRGRFHPSGSDPAARRKG